MTFKEWYETRREYDDPAVAHPLVREAWDAALEQAAQIALEMDYDPANSTADAIRALKSK